MRDSNYQVLMRIIKRKERMRKDIPIGYFRKFSDAEVFTARAFKHIKHKYFKATLVYINQDTLEETRRVHYGFPITYAIFLPSRPTNGEDQQMLSTYGIKHYTCFPSSHCLCLNWRDQHGELNSLVMTHEEFLRSSFQEITQAEFQQIVNFFTPSRLCQSTHTDSSEH